MIVPGLRTKRANIVLIRRRSTSETRYIAHEAYVKAGSQHMAALALRETAHGVELTVKVVPGSSRDRIVGVLGDALKIAVAAPPEKGKANRAVVDVLAKALGVKRNTVQIVAGHTQPRKNVLIAGVSAEQVSALIR